MTNPVDVAMDKLFRCCWTTHVDCEFPTPNLVVSPAKLRRVIQEAVDDVTWRHLIKRIFRR